MCFFFGGTMKIPNEVIHILNTLKSNGHEAYIVGGAVRNTVMGLSINDWDITTSAEPDVVECLFKRTTNVGKSFGTIIVHLEMDYEITTFRTESKYDGRKPEIIQYAKSITEDIRRRDFTMNAMYMDDTGTIYDVYNGRDSIQSRTIETVGQPLDRFTEDYLRVYRYVRFTTQYDLKYNPLIDQVIKEMPINTNISFERIREELNKILLSAYPSKGIRHLLNLGLLEYIMPEIIPCVGFDQHSEFHHLDVFDHCLSALDKSNQTLVLRLAALFHDIGKPSTFELIDGVGHFYGHDKASVQLTEIVLKRLKYSNEVIDEVLKLIAHHMRLLDLDNRKSVKKFIRKIGVDSLNNFLDLRRVDILSSTTNDDIISVELMSKVFEEIIHEKHPINVNDLAIDGHALMDLGIVGVEIGRVKEALLEIVLDDPSKNTYETLMKHAKVLISDL